MDIDRKTYFFRSPVEYGLNNLITAYENMASEYKEMKSVAIAYSICADQLRKELTGIIRDDNHQITVLKNAENMKMFGMISDELLNGTNNIKIKKSKE